MTCVIGTARARATRSGANAISRLSANFMESMGLSIPPLNESVSLFVTASSSSSGFTCPVSFTADYDLRQCDAVLGSIWMDACEVAGEAALVELFPIFQPDDDVQETSIPAPVPDGNVSIDGSLCLFRFHPNEHSHPTSLHSSLAKARHLERTHEPMVIDNALPARELLAIEAPVPEIPPEIASEKTINAPAKTRHRKRPHRPPVVDNATPGPDFSPANVPSFDASPANTSVTDDYELMFFNPLCPHQPVRIPGFLALRSFLLEENSQKLYGPASKKKRAAFQLLLEQHGISLIDASAEKCKNTLLQHVFSGECMQPLPSCAILPPACRSFSEGFRRSSQLKYAAFHILAHATSEQRSNDDMLHLLRDLHITTKFKPKNLRCQIVHELRKQMVDYEAPVVRRVLCPVETSYGYMLALIEIANEREVRVDGEMTVGELKMAVLESFGQEQRVMLGGSGGKLA